MSVIPVNFCQINYRFTGESAPNGAEVTMGADHTFFDGNVTEAAAAAAGCWVDSVLPFQCDDITLAEVMVKFGPNNTGAAGVWPVAEVGLDAGSSEAPAVSILVRKITADGGRAGRGRMYIPGVRDTRVDSGGHVDGTYAMDLGIGLVTYKDAMADADLVPVVLHGPDSPITTPSPIEFLPVQPYVGTQRRRQVH